MTLCKSIKPYSSLGYKKYRQCLKRLCMYCVEPNHVIAENHPNKKRFRARITASTTENILSENKDVRLQ